jgi:hypothetical protein
MQDLDEREVYGAIVSLSWSFHYCASASEAIDVLARFFRALQPGGLLLLQVAHAANATGRLLEDWETGPGGESDDIQFLYHFSALPCDEPTLRAQYVYTCRSLNELLAEEHVLSIADANSVGRLLKETGFQEIQIFNDWRREPLSSAMAPFVLGFRPASR